MIRLARSLHSLRWRILVLATLPMLALAAGLLAVSHVATSRALRANVDRSLADASSVFAEMVESRRHSLSTQARIVARDPRFFATFSVPAEERDEEFSLTLQLVAEEFLGVTEADYLQIFGPDGAPVAGVPPSTPWTHDDRGRVSLAQARGGEVSTDTYLTAGTPTVVADVPVYVGGRREGILRLGLWLDDVFAREVADLTGAEVRLHDGRATPEESFGEQNEWLATQVALPTLVPGKGCHALLARNLDQQLAPLKRAERAMAGLGLLALALTLLTAQGIAAGVTAPLRKVVEAAQRLRAGDYEAPLPVERVDEIGELARGFDDMRGSLRTYVRHLEDLDKVKSDFLALASHELRTPLTVIISFNDLLQSGAFGELPEDVAETNQIIKDQLTHLNELVQDMLDLVALEQKPGDALELEVLDLGAAAVAVVSAQATARRERDVEVRVETDPEPVWVKADARLFQRCIRALLDNAVRFTDDGGHVAVEVRRNEGRAVLRVHDDGIGIAPEDLRWIFDKFTEVGEIEHHRSGQLEFGTRGLGMGLSIVHATVRALHGEVDVHSRPGVGSRFTVTLPCATAPPERRSAELQVPLEVS